MASAKVQDDSSSIKSSPKLNRSRSSFSSHGRSRSLILEREAKISALEAQVNNLTNRLIKLTSSSSHIESSNKTGKSKKHMHPLTPHKTIVQESFTHSSSGASMRPIIQERLRMGRNASISTAAVFNSLPDDREDALAQKLVNMFKDPAAHLSYLKSDMFAKDLLSLAQKVKPILEEEPKCAFLQSPCYVFGDIHGNLEDLHFFSDNIWRLGMALTAGNFVFLGDYVDRGMSCLEVVAYLFSMKLLLPQKVFLLRGNHETRDVNGWEEHYGDRSFIFQCRDRFGDELGYRVWEEMNQLFDRLPLSAVIDQDIFCVHGGIPRPISSGKSRIQDILNVSKVAGINPPYEHEQDAYQQVASDCIWSDPASEEQEQISVNPENGFGESLRGGGAICFGHKAVTDFLTQHGFSYIMRAHEAHAEGVAVSKGARVFTLFSTSKDHNQGSEAMAGCMLVDFEKLQVINRSPAYRNQYVHRRDSVSIAKLTEEEIEQRADLGLVTSVPSEDQEDDDDSGTDEWQDYEDDSESSEEDEEVEYVIDTRRSSSVNPLYTIASPPGSSHDNHVVWRNSSFDMSNVSTSSRKYRKQKSSFGNETNLEDVEEEETSTVDGTAADCDMEDSNEENYSPVSSDSTTFFSTPAKRKNRL